MAAKEDFTYGFLSIKKYSKMVKTFPFVEEFTHFSECLADIEQLDYSSQEYLEIKEFIQGWQLVIGKFLLRSKQEAIEKIRSPVIHLFEKWFVMQSTKRTLTLIQDFEDKIIGFYKSGGVGHSFHLDTLDISAWHPRIPADKYVEVLPTVFEQLAMKVHKREWYIESVATQTRAGN